MRPVSILDPTALDFSKPLATREDLRKTNPQARLQYAWVPYDRISANLNYIFSKAIDNAGNISPGASADLDVQIPRRRLREIAVGIQRGETVERAITSRPLLLKRNVSMEIFAQRRS
jgi:hypothetical protein